MSENSNERPEWPKTAEQLRREAQGRVVTCILIVLLTLPASLIAFLSVCGVAAQITLATDLGNESAHVRTGLGAGAMAGVAVFCLVMWFAARVLQRK